MKEKFTKFEFEIADDTFVYALNERGVNQFDFNINGNGCFGATKEELTANAHLIAAAPKMYAMLEECALEIINLIDEVNDQRCAHVNLSTTTQPDLCDGETVHRIQKLLAEARGEL